MSDLSSTYTTKSQNLLNIVSGLKKRQKNTLPILKETVEPEPLVESAAPAEELSIGINDKTNYAPPGYLVWNYYYDTPLQKIPNDTEIRLKTTASTGIIVGFIDKIYKILVDNTFIKVEETNFTLKDESRREYYERVHIKNMEYHHLHPPTKNLEPLDLLDYDVRDVKMTENKGEEVDETTIEETTTDRYSVILCVIRSKSHYDMGFRYRVWNLYTSSHDKSHLVFYDNLLIERGVDTLYNDGYIKFYWAHSNGSPSLVPVEQMKQSIDNLPDFSEGVEYLKTTKPLQFRQTGGNCDKDVIKLEGIDIGDIPDIIMNEYSTGDDNFKIEIVQTFQPYPPRKSHASAELNVITRDPETRKKYRELLGIYEFIDRENYFGFIYKRNNYIIIKKGFEQSLEKTPTTEYETLQIYDDNYGECDDDTQCYWFIAKEISPEELNVREKPTSIVDDTRSVISNVGAAVTNGIKNIFSTISRYSENTERDEELHNKEVVERYFSDDEDEEMDTGEPIIRYKPILYSKAIHPTNSIPLNHEWFLVDSLKINKNVNVPVETIEEITDEERIVNTLNNNRFLLMPWSLEEITDYTTDERRVVRRDTDKDGIDMNSKIRIIKDFGYGGLNIRYFTGTVTSIKKEGIRKLYHINLDFPFITDEDIIVDRSFIEPLDDFNSLEPYFNSIERLQGELTEQPAYIYENHLKLIEQRIKDTNEDIDNLIAKTNLYEYFKQYLSKMVMNDSSVLQFNFTKIKDDHISATVDLSLELLKIDPFYKPTVKPHILNRLVETIQLAIGNDDLKRNYQCVIEDNWPPSIGDEVVVAEGRHKGKTGKIMDIKNGLNISTNGEAVLKIRGVRSPYQISMNYLLKNVENDLEYFTYPGYLRLNINITPSNSHSRVDIVEYENPKTDFNAGHIKIGDYVKMKKGGKILQVKNVDIDERIEPDYYVAETAGTPMIMCDNHKNDVLRSGLQYRINGVTADLYKLCDKPIANTTHTLVFSPFNNNITECDQIDRKRAIQFIERAAIKNKKNSPLDRLDKLVRRRR